MKDIHEVIREKEAQLARITEELTELRLTLRLLSEDSADKSGTEDSLKPAPSRIKNFP